MRLLHLLAIVTICAGCVRNTPPAPAPTPPPPLPAPPPHMGTAPSVLPPLYICVVGDDGLRMVPVEYVPSTGDSLYQGRPFRDAFPTGAEYAANAEWYVDNSTVSFNGQRFTNYGQPRPLASHELTRIGEHRGVGVYVELAQIEALGIIYLPVRPGCEFQPYQATYK